MREIEYELNDISIVAKQLLEDYSTYNIWCFHADLGAGKTTLIKELAKLLGVKDVASSPTFSIINEYQGEGDTPVYHYDFYRIENEEEAFDLGIEDQFYSKSFCFIEWPEKIINLIPDNALHLKIEGVKNNRKITIAS